MQNPWRELFLGRTSCLVAALCQCASLHLAKFQNLNSKAPIDGHGKVAVQSCKQGNNASQLTVDVVTQQGFADCELTLNVGVALVHLLEYRTGSTWSFE